MSEYQEDIVKRAQVEIHTFERPSVSTSKIMMDEIIALRKRIAELEKECERLYEANQEAKEFIYSYIKAPRSKIYGSDPIYNAEKEFEAIKLEQQAKGVEDAIAFFHPAKDLDTEALRGYAEQLRQKAKD